MSTMVEVSMPQSTSVFPFDVRGCFNEHLPKVSGDPKAFHSRLKESMRIITVSVAHSESVPLGLCSGAAQKVTFLFLIIR